MKKKTTQHSHAMVFHTYTCTSYFIINADQYKEQKLVLYAKHFMNTYQYSLIQINTYFEYII